VPAPVPVSPPEPPLWDAAVALRPWGEADLAAMVAMNRDPDVARFTRVPEPYHEADARAWLAAQPERQREGEGLALAIVAEAGGAPVGSVGLRVEPGDREIAELSYIVAPWARGRGIATAAARLLAAWALREWGLARLQLTTFGENAASQRVAEQAGFRREGVLRSWDEIKGRRVDLVVYSRLPGDA
jgi:RimJ/RimL family protein N-acetyltransferase